MLTKLKLEIYEAVFTSANKLVNGCQGKHMRIPCFCDPNSETLVQCLSDCQNLLGDDFIVSYSNGEIVVGFVGITNEFLYRGE